MFCGYKKLGYPKPKCSYRMKHFECHCDEKCKLQVEGIEINKRARK